MLTRSLAGVYTRISVRRKNKRQRLKFRQRSHFSSAALWALRKRRAAVQNLRIIMEIHSAFLSHTAAFYTTTPAILRCRAAAKSSSCDTAGLRAQLDFAESNETFKHLVLPRKRQISSVKPRPANVSSGWVSERWRAVPIGYLPTGWRRKHLLTVASRRPAAWRVRIMMQKSHVGFLEVCVSDLFIGVTAASAAPSRQHHVRSITQCSNFVHWQE